MRARRRDCCGGLVGACALAVLFFAPQDSSGESADVAQRIISLNPSLTQILLALDARDSLVGIDDYSTRQNPGLESVPIVGGLYNPSLEAVTHLEPDLVVLVPSAEQRDFRRRLEALGVRVEVFENLRFEQVLENIERLGVLVGREAQAGRRIAAIRAVRARVARATADRHRPRTLLVLQRDPVFVAGGGSFIHEMLVAAGADNLGAEFDDAYPRVAIEWVVAGAPEVLLDMSPDATDAGDDSEAVSYWARWPSLPAVSGARVLRLPQHVTLPGPHLDAALEALATALHGAEALTGAPVPPITAHTEAPVPPITAHTEAPVPPITAHTEAVR